MSNDSPFVAPGNDPAAPLQAPPVAQAEVPPFGGAPAAQPGQPAAGGVAQAPYPAPAAGYGYAGVPAAPPQPLKPNRGLAIAMAILSAAYSVLCLVEIFALAHRASLANQIINDPQSVTVDQADSADNMVSSLSVVALAVFIATLVVMAVWQRSLRGSLGPTGRYQAVLKESGYQVFRVVWLVSLGLAIFLRGSGNIETPQDVVSHDHKFMLYYGLRAALGLVVVYFALRLMRVVQRNLTLAQTGYSQEAVNYLSS
ncbi:hypothetical protein [Actinocrinis sp.]|uniref:hypothetical protein n=1 Tax=Actinocrinis sp. TaxID=1920516 RepID=UPI002D5F797D|nr:hypothetical protein [Actinocrinis sp.]HZP54193.1 hypothetical protein [Actinocrinis sp.]